MNQHRAGLFLVGAMAVGGFAVGKAVVDHYWSSQAGEKSIPDKWRFSGPLDSVVATTAAAGAVLYVALNAQSMVESWLLMVE